MGEGHPLARSGIALAAFLFALLGGGGHLFNFLQSFGFGVDMLRQAFGLAVTVECLNRALLGLKLFDVAQGFVSVKVWNHGFNDVAVNASGFGGGALALGVGLGICDAAPDLLNFKWYFVTAIEGGTHKEPLRLQQLYCLAYRPVWRGAGAGV